MYCIVNWLDRYDYSDLSLVLREDGNLLLFTTEEDAEEEVDKLNGYTVVVDLH